MLNEPYLLVFSGGEGEPKKKKNNEGLVFNRWFAEFWFVL